MSKSYFVIKNDSGTIMKDITGKLRFFQTATEAMIAIETEYHNSPYLKPVRWSNNKNVPLNDEM